MCLKTLASGYCHGGLYQYNVIPFSRLVSCNHVSFLSSFAMSRIPHIHIDISATSASAE